MGTRCCLSIPLEPKDRPRERPVSSGTNSRWVKSRTVRRIRPPRANRFAMFHDLRAEVMTRTTRTEAAKSHQGSYYLSCQPGSPHPSGARCHVRRAKPIRRFSHGNARAIENLRGVRVFVVSPPFT